LILNYQKIKYYSY